MENTKKITGDMLVGQICAEHPEAVPALQAVGMDPEKVVAAVNAALAD